LFAFPDPYYSYYPILLIPVPGLYKSLAGKYTSGSRPRTPRYKTYKPGYQPSIGPRNLQTNNRI
jgi:hypothetical protein